MDDILRSYGDLLGEVDRWFTGCSTAYPQQIVCAGGCSSCCRGLFDITLPDAALLKSGFELLPQAVRTDVTRKARERVKGIRKIWPEFSPPYLLSHRPEEEWPRIMPEDDDTPCVLLDPDGRCLLYDYRPMTCRLHGLPLVDLSGELLDDSFCPLNFAARDPLTVAGLRGEFAELFRKETDLISRFNSLFNALPTAQMDTLIPAALLSDCSGHGRRRR